MNAPKYVVLRHSPGTTIGGKPYNWINHAKYVDEEALIAEYNSLKSSFESGALVAFSIHPVEFEATIKIKERR